MGLSSVATTSDTVQFCIFDLKRGQHEGQELDKILFFFPADLPFSTQLSVIGLSEGLITFSRIFSPEAPCEVIEADRHSHVFYEPEPDIWMVMVVEKSKESEALWRIDALRKVLKEVHSLFVLFHGSIRTLLEKEPSGGLIRSHLYSFIMDYLSDFFVVKKLQLPSFCDSLKERGTVQMLTVGREAAIEVQSLVRVLEACAGNTSCYSLVLFQDLLVSTTLFPDDTINLFTYAVLRLSPHALSSGVSSWSYLRKGNAASQGATASTLAHSSSIPEQIYHSRDTSPVGDNRYHVARPLQRNKWSKGNDGFLVSDIWGTEAGSSISATPTVLLMQTEEKMYLCAYQHRNLTLILLFPVSSILNGEQGIAVVKQQVLENASLKILKVEEKLSKGWGGENAYHVGGYRYLLVDGDRNISRASPPGKVTTLTKESLEALSSVREEVDLEKSRAKWDNAGLDKDLEICIRAKNNAWVIGRVTRGKELYMVLEKADGTLLYASDAVEKFSSRLAILLPSIISPNQFGFVRGRNIQENIALCFELTHHIRDKVVGDNIILKLDMSKAYDRLEWNFLLRALRAFGFGEPFIDLIWRCLCNCWYSVLINGTTSGYFRATRGVRQGDPLSPALFIIAQDVLSRNIEHGLRIDTMHAYHCRGHSISISHLMFANDTIVFLNGLHSLI